MLTNLHKTHKLESIIQKVVKKYSMEKLGSAVQRLVSCYNLTIAYNAVD